MNRQSLFLLTLLACGFIGAAAAQPNARAMQHYTQAVEYHNQALKLFDEKKYTEGNQARAKGIEAYRKAIELDPRLFDGYVNLGDLYRKNAPGSTDVLKAVEAYKKALELRPDDAATYNRLNLAHWSLDNVAEAVAATEQAVRLSPKTPVYLYNLGFQHANLGHFAEARAAQARLQALDPAMAQKLLGEIQKMSGESSLIGRPANYANPKIDLVWIKPGTFMMGAFSAIGTKGSPVTFENGFHIGKYPVTQAQWQAVMGDNPSFFKNCGGNCPVEQVSWHDAQAFVLRLNKLDDGYRYRLPSEAEWEYAYRAGTTSGTYADGDIGWHSGNSGRKTHSVGEKPANGFGLFDMGGLVNEWCSDLAKDDRMRRVIRGNSFYAMSITGGTNSRSGPVDEVSRNNGFRVAAEKAK